MIGSKGKSSKEADPRCPGRPWWEKRVSGDIVRQFSDQAIAVRTGPGIGADLGGHTTMRDPAITTRPKTPRLSGRVPEKVIGT